MGRRSATRAPDGGQSTRIPRRSELAACVDRRLSRGGWGNADVLLVRHGGRELVVKDFAPRGRLLRASLGRWLIRRELRAYRELEGLDGVPRLLGVVDSFAIALEYRPGRHLSRALADVLPDGFLAELRAAVAAMHARGVVHLDLRHRSNILATSDGHPVLIDFASSLRFAPGSIWSRWLLACFAWIDRRALRKWEQRLGSGAAGRGR